MNLIKNVKKINKSSFVFVLLSALALAPLVTLALPRTQSSDSVVNKTTSSSEVVGYRVRHIAPTAQDQDLLLPDHVLPSSKSMATDARTTVLLPEGVEALPSDVQTFLHLSYLHHHSSLISAPPQSQPLSISLKKEHLVAKISQKYSVSRHQAKEIVAVAYQEAHKHNMDPILVLSVIATESSFDPKVKNSSSGAMGLMQAIPRWHHDKMSRLGISHGDLFGISSNIRLGTVILKEYLRLSNGNMVLALQKYNGSAKDPRRRYSNKVFGHYRWLSSSNL